MSHIYLISRTYDEDYLEKTISFLANCRENHQKQKQMDSIKCNKGARAHQDLRKSSKSKLYTEKVDEDTWGVVLNTQSVYLTKGASPSLNFGNSACFSASLEKIFHSSCAFLVIESFFATGLDFISRRQHLNKSKYFKIFYSVEFDTFWYATLLRH